MNRLLGKKKTPGKKKVDKKAPVPQPPISGSSGKVPASSNNGSAAAAGKSIDDQSYSKWVQDHNNEDEQYIEDEGQEAIVLYNYTPKPESGVDDEIALEKDEIIIVYEQHPSGWWTGQSAKHGYGLFPGSFVKLRPSNNSSPPTSSSSPTSSNTTPLTTTTTTTTSSSIPSTSTSSLPPDPSSTEQIPHQQKPERPPALDTSRSGSNISDGSETSASKSSESIENTSSVPSPTTQASAHQQPAEKPKPTLEDEPAPVKKSPSTIVRTGSSSTLPLSSSNKGSSSSSSSSSSVGTENNEGNSDSLYLKSVLDQLYGRVSALQTRVPQLESLRNSSISEFEALKKENADLKKQLEDMKIEKELSGWKHDKEVAELKKEIAKLSEAQHHYQQGGDSQDQIAQLASSLASERARVAELTEQLSHSKQGSEEIAALKIELARESAALSQEKAANALQAEEMLNTQRQIRQELEEVRAQLRDQQVKQPSSSPAFPTDIMAHIQSYMDQKAAEMQADLLHLKKEVAKDHQTESSLEQELAALRKQLDNEQRERAKLRQDLIDQMTTSQINRIKQEVLQRAEVKEGKLWDPVNNVFLAADGKWLRPTGVDLTQ